MGFEPVATALGQALIGAYRRAKRELGYTPDETRSLIVQLGPVEAARKLLRGETSIDTQELLRAGRPDLTVESLALLPAYEGLFSEGERRKARSRLPSSSAQSAARGSGAMSEVTSRLNKLASELSLRISSTDASVKYAGASGRLVWIQPRKGRLYLDLRAAGLSKPDAAAIRNAVHTLGGTSSPHIPSFNVDRLAERWHEIKKKVFIPYFGHPRMPEGPSPKPRSANLSSDYIEGLIAEGEKWDVEFKQSARWDESTKQRNPLLEREVARSVAGFLNSRDGGFLIVGVRDDGVPIGLDGDFKLVQPKGADGFQNWLTTMIGTSLGRNCLPDVRIRITSVATVRICLVAVSPAARPTFLTEESNSKSFYLRLNNSTRRLNDEEMLGYVLDRFPNLSQLSRKE